MRDPLGGVTIDATGRAPGRGAYLCHDAACWSSAARRRAIEHALGIALPADVAAAIAAGPPAAESTPNPTADTRAAQPAPAPETETDQGGARGQE